MSARGLPDRCRRRLRASLALSALLAFAACAGTAPEGRDDGALQALIESQRRSSVASDPGAANDAEEPSDVAVAEAPAARSTAEGRLAEAAARFADGDAAGGESVLRAELASGPRPVAAALLLVDYLTSREDFDAALAVVTAAERRAPASRQLPLARARLLFDLAQPNQAAEILQPLAERPDVHPRVLYELARAERSRLRLSVAFAHVRALRKRFADHEWVREHARELTSLSTDLEAEVSAGRRRFIDARELLAVLRASRSSSARLRALRSLDSVGGAAQAAALRLATVDEHPTLRLEALRMRCSSEAPAPCLETALEDPDGTVRAGAARLAAALLAEGEAVPLLLAALERESDDYAFRRLHEALGQLAGDKIPLPTGALDDERRGAVRRQWRERWAR